MVEYRLGFKALAAQLGKEVVGEPLGEEMYIGTGEEVICVQSTTKGLMYWDKKANHSMFLPSAPLDDGGSDVPALPVFRWPTQGPITQGFGENPDIYPYGPLGHQGIDIGAGRYDGVMAARAGTIVLSGQDPDYPLRGNVVYIDHEDGWISKYFHLARVLEESGWVSQGTVIGSVGETGYTFGPHLHFQVEKDGVAVDPQTVLP